MRYQIRTRREAGNESRLTDGKIIRLSVCDLSSGAGDMCCLFAASIIERGLTMQELGTDDQGRRMVRTDDGKLKIILPTGQSATMSRKHLVETIARHQADINKWQRYLNALDGLTDQDREKHS